MDQHDTASLSITAGFNELAIVRQFVQGRAAAFRAEPQAADEFLLAVNEIVTNSIEHGYHGQPGPVEIEIWQQDDALVAQLRDFAPPFDPTTVAPPDLSLPLHLRPIGGMGIHLVRHLVDEMLYRVRPTGGNEVILVKRGSIKMV